MSHTMPAASETPSAPSAAPVPRKGRAKRGISIVIPERMRSTSPKPAKSPKVSPTKARPAAVERRPSSASRRDKFVANAGKRGSSKRIVAPADSSRAVKDLYEGFLKVRSMLGMWNAKWCVLSNNRLRIYKQKFDFKASLQDGSGKSAPVPQRVLDLSHCTYKVVSNDIKRRRTLEISDKGGSGKPVLLSAGTDEEFAAWTAVLRHTRLSGSEGGPLGAEYEKIKVLGKGNFGKVILVRRRADEKLFAVKIWKKRAVIDSKQVKNTRTEVAVLRQLRHPFIVNIRFSFQTDTNLYMGMDYAPGGELFFHLRKLGRLNEGRVRLYMAELSLAIDYLHRCGVVFRDLKPENIMLDADGHIKLTDFGLVKILAEKKNASGLCGTPYYIAPELISGDVTAAKSADWWGVGIIAYELLTGRLPWDEEATTPSEVFRSVLRDDIEFEQADGVSEPGMRFVYGLTCKYPEYRLGCRTRGFAEILQHEWFAGLDWDAIYNRRTAPEFKPVINHQLDLCNFDSAQKELPLDSPVAHKDRMTEDGRSLPSFKNFSFIGDLC